ncbi:HNH endonuclease signature motif containing protein [Streptomyces subrutilus]|uniref:HNH endonuclease signature motif containing protein n=1 Tax=Streptomyces subrutilus TaxID=36818 RepID=UPI002E134996|nr:HNH endonuclease [Streptomyces subrutilus]
MTTIITPPPDLWDPRLPARFWAKVSMTESGCWAWTAQVAHHGYARFELNGRPTRAHRTAYESLVGPIPEGLVLDHLCRVRHCVNPAHLEPVTVRENHRRGDNVPPTRRGKARPKALCAQGHPLSGDNLGVSKRGERRCRACQRRWSQESRARKVAQTDGAR